MTAPLIGLALTAIGALSAAVANNPKVVEAFARTNIERARAEFRQGKQAAGDALLGLAVARLDRFAEHQQTPLSRLEIIRAVASSLKGQGMEQRGEHEMAAQSFASAARWFSQIPEETLSPRDRSDFGVALAALGSVAQARRQIEAARANMGGTPEAATHLARILLGAGDTGGAEQLLREALSVLPDDADALALLASIQADSGEPDAVATLAQAVSTYLERGRPRDALAALRQVGQAVSGDPGLTILRAEALRFDGRFDAAVVEYDRALASRPDDPWLLGGRGAALMGLGRIDDARADLDRALAMAPDSVALLLTASELAFRLGDMSTAGDYAERATSIDTDNATAFGFLAQAEAIAGSPVAALAHILKARALTTSDDIDLLRLHAEIMRAAGSDKAAADLFRELCELPASTPADHLALARLLDDLDQVDDAIMVVEAAAGRWDHQDADLESQHGELLIRAERSQAAVEVLRRARDLDPDSAKTSAQLAIALALSGDDDGALAEADIAAEKNPDWSEPHRIRAEIMAGAGRWREATAAARQVLARDSESVDALRILARERLHAGATDEAVALLRQGMQIRQDDPSTALLLARALLDTHPLEALEVLNRPPQGLEEHADDYTEWLMLRGLLLSRQRQWPQAEADLTRATEIHPDLADVWAELADVARLRGDPVQALAHADEAILRDPRHVFARCCRAAVLMQLGRADEVRAELDAALQIDPDYAWGLVLLSRTTDDAATAHSLLERALAQQPDSRELRVEQAWLHMRFGDYEQALDLFDKLLKLGRDAEALTGRADALRSLGRFKEAVETAAEAVGLGQDRQAQRSLGLALLDSGDSAGAVHALSRAHQSDPDDVRTAADLGYALAAMDQLDDALDILDRSVAAAPYDVWTLGQLVSVLNDIGHFGSAARLARRAVALDPEDPATWSGLGWALQYGSPPDLAAAEDAYRQAWNRQPKDQPDPWVLSGIADTYHLRGDVQRAAADYERALEIADRGRTLNRAMVSVVGWCQFRLGDLDNATRAFLESSSMETLPGSDGFDLALAMLCDGRHKRAEAAYTEAVARVEERHPLRRRGYLAVGLADLRQARADYRDLRDHEAAAKIEGVLLSALNALPPLPDLRTTRLLDEPYSPPHH